MNTNRTDSIGLVPLLLSRSLDATIGGRESTKQVTPRPARSSKCRRAHRSWCAFVLVMWIAACVGGGDNRLGEGWEAVIDTVGDTVVVRTVSGSVWGDTAYLEPEVSIGLFEGPDEYMIGDPSSITVGQDGVIYVLDRQVPVIRAYDRDGKYLRDIGREGGGPGEYKLPGALATLPDGRLVLRDPGNGRLTVFSPEGECERQLWFPGGFNTSRPMYVDTAGFIYSLVLLNYGTAPWDWEYGLVRMSAEQGIIDTVVAPVWDYEPAELTATREGSSSASRVPFTAEESWTFSPLGYMVGGLSSEYRVDLYREYEPVLRIEREWTPVPVKAEEKEERRRRATDNMRRQYPGWQWNGPGIPDHKAPFTELIVSGEGNIWVQVSQEGRPTMTEAEAREEERRTDRPALRFAEPAAYDVFDPGGRFLGHVRVPESFRTRPEPLIRGDTVWAVTRDEWDVASVVRLRVVRRQ